MAEEKKETEELIFKAACRVFQRKGYAGARMQEIANEAEINKSMLHYYYRSKDKLFHEVFQKEISRFFPVVLGVLSSGKALETKVEQMIDAYYNFLRANPYMVQFVMLEMNQHPKRFRKFIRERGIRPPKRFVKQVDRLAAEGRIDPIRPEQLLVSIIGVILFPFIARVMVQSLFELNDQEYLQFLEERKSFLTEFILNGINYKRI